MGHVFGFVDGEEDVTTLIPISSWYGKTPLMSVKKNKILFFQVHISKRISP
jgi:hypothetical protein